MSPDSKGDDLQSVISVRSAKIVALVLAICFLLPVSLAARADTPTTKFTFDESPVSSVTVGLPPYHVDYNASIDFPADEVLDVSFLVSPEDDDGEYSDKVWIDVRNNDKIDWAYEGNGYGAFGEQTRFASSRTTHSFAFGDDSGDPDSTTLLIPKGATITDATVDISGRPAGTDDLEDGVTASVSTNQGSYSRYSQTAKDASGNIHVVWTDNGDLFRTGSNLYQIFYNRWDGSKWRGTDIISMSNMSNNYPPAIAVSGDNVYVAWKDRHYYNGSWYYTIDFTRSLDNGDTWSEHKNIAGEYDYANTPYYPTLEASGTNVYASWHSYWNNSGDYNYDIFFRASQDWGENWGNIHMISPTDKADPDDYQYSQYPDISLGGSTIFVAWYDNGNFDNDNTIDYDVVLRSSSNGGNSWSNTRVISTSAFAAYQPKVAASSGSNVFVTWYEYDNVDFNYTIQYRRSTNGGSNWQAEQTLSDTNEEYYPTYPDIAAYGSFVYVAWSSQDRSSRQEDDVWLRISDNTGNTFGDAERIHEDTYSTGRERVRLDISPSSGDLLVTWTDDYDVRLPGVSERIGPDPDIWVRESLNEGASWNNTLVASDGFFEGDSYTPRVYLADDGTFYLVYWDGGDLTGNGNYLSTRTNGDWFFARSTDEGETWTDHMVLTQRVGHAYNYYTYTYMPSIVTDDSGNVYALWHEYNNYNYTQDDRYQYWLRTSDDKGASWNDAEMIYANDSALQYPNLVFEDDELYFFFYKSRSLEYQVYLMRSTDQGASWTDPEPLRSEADAETSASYISTSVSGQNIVVGWVYSSRANYIVSTDGGHSFSEREQMPTEETVTYPQFTVDGSDIYVVWVGLEDSSDTSNDVVFMRSGDLGETWDDPIKLSQEMDVSGDYYYYVYYPSLISDDGLLYVTYLFRYTGDPQPQYDVFMAFSPDYGLNWEHGQLLSDNKDNTNAYSMYSGMTANGNAMMTWSDRDSKSNHQQIWTRMTKATSYPHDPAIDIGGDGTYEWSLTGEMNRTNSPKTWSAQDGYSTKSLKKALNDALGGGNVRQPDKWGIEMVELTIEATSSSEGRILLNEMSITYDVSLLITNTHIKKTLNYLVNNTEEDIAVAPIAVWGSSQGAVRFHSLFLDTAVADLKLTNLRTTGQPLEGHDIDVLVDVANTGTGATDLSIKFWAAEKGKPQDANLTNTIADLFIEDLPVDSEASTHSVKWNDIPDGEYNVYAQISSSDPPDLDPQASDFKVNTDITITPTSPNIAISIFEVTEEALEGDTADIRVAISNSGDRDAEVRLRLYERSKSGELVGEYILPVELEDENEHIFTWNVTQVDQLTLVAKETDIKQTEESTIDVDVRKLPFFICTNLSWDPSVVSEGTEATFTMTWEYRGDIQVTASTQLIVSRSDSPLKATPISASGRSFTQEGDTPTLTGEVSFDPVSSIFSNELEGDYIVDARIYLIKPVSIEFKDKWDPNTLEYTEQSKDLRVDPPPDLEIDDLEVEDELEGGKTTTIEVTIYNGGGSAAQGVVELYVYLVNTLPGSIPTMTYDFQVNAQDTSRMDLEWDVPRNFDGVYNFEVRLEEIQPPESQYANPNNDRTYTGVQIHGNVELNDDDSGIPVWFYGVLVALIAGMGVGGFLFMRKTAPTAGADAGGASPGALPSTPGSKPDPAAPSSPSSPAAPGAPPPDGGAPEGPPDPGGTDGPPEQLPAPVTLPCPACQTKLKVTSAERPLLISCPSCSTKLKLES